MASKYQAPARDLRRPARAGARAGAGSRRAAAAIFARAGYEPIATPAFEDTELFERGVGQSTDIVRKEMFTFEDKGERSLTLRPGGDGADLPRLPRARHAQTGAAGEALLRRAVLPPRAPAGRPLPPVPPARGRGDRHRLAARRRRGDHAALRPARRARRAGGRAAARQPRLARGAARLPGGAEGAPARPRGGALRGRARADRHQPAARLRLRRRGDAGGDGERADDRRAARGRGRRALRRGAGAARRRRDRLRRSTRPWSAASTTTRGRSSPSSATRSARSRRSAAAAATTA